MGVVFSVLDRCGGRFDVWDFGGCSLGVMLGMARGKVVFVVACVFLFIGFILGFLRFVGTVVAVEVNWKR